MTANEFQVGKQLDAIQAAVCAIYLSLPESTRDEILGHLNILGKYDAAIMLAGSN